MNQLITKSLGQKDVSFLASFPKGLLTPSEKVWIEWIQEYTIKFGQPPTLARFQEEYPTFFGRDSEDPLGDLYERELKAHRSRFTRHMIKEHEESLRNNEDPLEWIEDLYQLINQGSANVDTYSTFDRSTYFREIVSFPFGVNILDKNTGGIAQGDLGYIVGRLGSGKTTFAEWLVVNWWRQGHRILIASNENRSEDVIGKIDAFVGGWNPLKKRTGEWTEADRGKAQGVSYLASRHSGEIIVPKRPVPTVTQLQGLIQSYQPEIVVVDGVYLMGIDDKGATWERVSDVSRELKQVAMNEAVPILGIHQSNRASAGTKVQVHQVAYSDALAQDADLLLGVNAEDEPGLILVEILKSRWGKTGGGFFVKTYYDSMDVRVYDTKYIIEEED